MYAAHVPPICAAMRASPEAFARGVMFASLSIKQPITRVPQLLDEWAETKESAGLFGFKRLTSFYIEEHAAELWERVCAVPLSDPAAALLILLEVPGLGIVKAGFVCQFLGFDVACLDTRNVEREARDPRAFRTDGKPPAKLRPKVDRYLAETQGHARRYWDEWCEDAGQAHGLTAFEISALHLAIIPDSYIPF